MIHRLSSLLRIVLACSMAGALRTGADDSDLFEKRVRPLLEEHCYSCHSARAEKLKGGLRLDSRDAMLKGGDSGKPAVSPGNPKASLLMIAIRHADPDLKMPPKKAKLSDQQISDIESWILSGAKFPAVASAAKSQGPLWSFSPLSRPPLPSVKRRGWVQSPVDAFILARLESKGLSPAPAADKRTLLRRVTFDLTGLPPTPDEMESFLNDKSSNAYSRVVDRLLASPRYGERWGRHWLDVVRYSDTAGDSADYPIPEIYLYRNYVIQSFNQDKPFERFLMEQVAGDLLPWKTDAQKNDGVIATGFLALARRFSTGPEKHMHLTIEDTIDTLGRSMMGLSIGCARCHNHKFDPISSRDYYGLYGIFSSTRYPQAGSEENHRPYNFVPLEPVSGLVTRRAYAVTEGTPANARIQKRGDPANPGDEVPRGFIQALGGGPLPASVHGSGRKELAEWIVSPANPLTARVFVNRIWQHHFGRGIVPTPNDFGRQGQPPSHPELLDWLAASLRDHAPGAESIKALHRTIVLSSVYRMADIDNPRARQADPENALLWHFKTRRLDAEEVRDAMLAVSGSLDETAGAAHPFPPEDKWAFSQHDPFTAIYDSRRRTVYVMQQRLRKHPFLALFDGADANATTAARLAEVTPLQALFMMNDPFAHDQAARFAARVCAERTENGDRLKRAYQLLLGRSPQRAELKRDLDYLNQYKQKPGQDESSAWTSLARALFSSNEFIFL